MRFLFARNDPHAVYARLIPYLDIAGGDLFISSRIFSKYSSDYYFVRLMLLLFSDVFSILVVSFSSARVVFVREYSSFVYLLLLPILIFAKIRKSIYLNINHNLNSRSSVFASRVLALFFDVVFIEPSPSLLEKNVWVRPVFIQRPKLRRRSCVDGFYVFAGNRAEQFMDRRLKYFSMLNSYFNSVSVPIKFVGAEFGLLSDEDFISLYAKDVCIIMLYDLSSYTERHSGVVLEALCNGVCILLPRSDLATHYASRGFDVQAFDDVDSLRIQVQRMTESTGLNGVSNVR